MTNNNLADAMTQKSGATVNKLGMLNSIFFSYSMFVIYVKID